MAATNTFNAPAYFKMLAEKNRLARKKNFFPCFCSGPDGINDVMQEFKKWANFIMIDDTTSQNTFSRGIGYFDRNAYTVFILAAYRFDDMADREQKLDLCRRIFRQFHSRMIRDKEKYTYGDSLEYLQVHQIYSKELPRYSMSGVTGLYFMVNNEEPVDLTYNDNDWEDADG